MWTCPKCKREFLKRNQSHSCVVFPIENHFKGKGEVPKLLFDELVQRIEKSIGPLKIESLPCCIHLVSHYTFSGVWALRDKIRIDFRLDEKIHDPRISKELKMSANRYLYYVEIKNDKDIDDKLVNWLGKAYNLGYSAGDK